MTQFINYLNESALPKVLYHGTVGKLILKPGLLYLTDDKDAAMIFGTHPILARGRSGKPMLYKFKPKVGKIKNIDGVIMDAFENDTDVEDAITEAGNKARKAGFRYVTFDHGGEFQVYVSLYPDKDLKQLVNEEYYDTLYVRRATRSDYPVYKNPSGSDLKELVIDRDDRSVRFLVDIDKKDIYVFSANILHDEARKQIKPLNAGNKSYLRVLYGLGWTEGNKIHISAIYYNRAMDREDWTTWPLDWCKSYFSNNIRDKIKDYEDI